MTVETNDTAPSDHGADTDRDLSVDYITTATAADILAVSQRTVCRYLESGKLKGHKAELDGGLTAWRIEADSVQAMVEEKEQRHERQTIPRTDTDTRLDEALRAVNTLSATVRTLIEEDSRAIRLLPPAREELAAAQQERDAERGRAEALQQELETERDRAETAEREATALREALDAEKGRSWWQRLIGRQR